MSSDPIFTLIMCDKTKESKEDEAENTGEVRGCIIYSHLNESTFRNCLLAVHAMKTKRDLYTVHCNPQSSVTEELRSVWAEKTLHSLSYLQESSRRCTELKIAHYLPWQATIYFNSHYCSLTHGHTHIMPFVVHSAPARSEKRITKQIKGKEG